VQTLNTLFERELTKRIDEELVSLRETLESPSGIQSFEQYKFIIGQIRQLDKVKNQYFDDVNKVINER
jgi:hypothetical protein